MAPASAAAGGSDSVTLRTKSTYMKGLLNFRCHRRPKRSSSAQTLGGGGGARRVLLISQKVGPSKSCC